MVIIYTGNGKGKTSASVGQAIRALGQGMAVAFGQFMKKDVNAGEQHLLRTLPDLLLHVGGSGFFRHENERPVHRQAALATVQWAQTIMAEHDLVVLDEALYALGKDLITREELAELMALAKRHNTHLVLSGRGLPAWLRDQADLITEMTEIKHPWQLGIPAARGIEF